MSRYKPYPSYKESRVEWLGNVPEHWEVKSLKSILQERKENNNPIKTIDILSLCMYRGVIPYSEKGSGGNKAKEDLTAYKLAYPNDIVLNSMNVVAGSVGLSKYFGAVSPVYYMLRPRNERDKVEYFNNIFQSETFQKSLFGLGNGIMVKESESSGKLNTIRMRIPMEKLNTVPLPYPSSSEQTTIVNFLDRETAKIDTLIAKQERMIELLNEKRSVIISHAITKGLDPNVKMKDSGVKWLGEVPEHWAISKVKFEASFEGGSTPSKDKPNYWNGDVFWVSPKDMKSRYINSSIDTITAEGQTANNLSIIQADSVLMVVRSGILQRTIPVAITTGPVTLNQDMKALTFKNTVLPEYFVAMVEGLTSQLLLAWRKQGATVESIESEYLANSPMPVPPHIEQEAIISFIADFDSKSDKLIAKARQAIELMKERRTALISAAVTGKIDVREQV